MKRYINAFGILLVVVSLVYVAFILHRYVGTIPEFQWSLSSIAAIGASIAYFQLAYLLIIEAWMLLVINAGGQISFAECFSIMGRSQIGKYLPGNIFHYAGRVGLAYKQGISLEVATVTTGIETGVILVIAMLLVVAGYAANSPDTVSRFHLDDYSRRVPFEIGIVLLIIAGLLSFSSRRIRSWLSKRKQYFKPRTFVNASLLYLAYFIPIGLFLRWIIVSLWSVQAPPWYELTWGFTLAWTLGFIVPGASGGIGIREAVFVALFGSRMGEGLAVGLAVLLRVITILGDLLTFVIAFWLEKKRSHAEVL